MILLIGPSGVGKNTILDKVLRNDSTLKEVVSHTTREPRLYNKSDLEIEGIHYHFINKEEFERLESNGGFVETNKYSGNYYGIAERSIRNIEVSGSNPIAIVDVNGADSIIKKFKNEGKEVLSIFIKPPSLDVLRTRLLKRKGIKSDEVEARILIGEEECGLAFKYDFQVTNDNLNVASNKILNMIQNFTGY